MKRTLIICSIVIFYCSTHLTILKNDMVSYSEPKPVIAAAPIVISWEQQIRQALTDAGFNPEQTDIMMAVGQAESGLRIDALGDLTLQTETWGPSIGVFQIRTLKHPPYPCRDLGYLTQNLSHQAACAYQISKQGADFRPWTTYVSEAYKNYMPH